MARHAVLCGSVPVGGMSSGHFYPVNGGRQAGPTDGGIEGLCAVAGTACRLRFTISAAVAVTTRLILYIEQAATSLQVTIPAGSTSGSDLVNEAPVTAGDRISVLYTGDNGVNGYWEMEIDSGLTNFSLIMSGGYRGFANPTVAYTGINWSGDGNLAKTVEADTICVAPIACTIKSLYIRNSASAFPAGQTVTVTLRVNGADSLLTATATGAYGEASDTVHEISIAKGDRLCWSCLSSGAGIPMISLGAVVVPATPTLEEAIWISGIAPSDLTPAAALYACPLLNGPAYGAVLAETQLMVRGSLVIGNLYVRLSTNPGAAASGKSYTFTLYLNGIATALTCTVLELATTAEDAVNQVTLTDGDLISLGAVPANSPSVASASWGMSVYGLAPTITAISVAQGMRGSTFAMTITGTNLGNAGSIDLGSGVSVEIVSCTATEITATVSVDSGAALTTRDVTVYTECGTATLAGGFTVIINPVTALDVSTQPVTGITEIQATANGYVTENAGDVVICYFQWGLTRDYGTTTRRQPVLHKGDSFSDTLSLLSPGVQYHVRAVMETRYGTFHGVDTVFSTQVPPHLPSLIMQGDFELIGIIGLG